MKARRADRAGDQCAVCTCVQKRGRSQPTARTDYVISNRVRTELAENTDVIQHENKQLSSTVSVTTDTINLSVTIGQC